MRISGITCVHGLTNWLAQCWVSEQLHETQVCSFHTASSALPGWQDWPATGYLVMVLLFNLPLGGLQLLDQRVLGENSCEPRSLPLPALTPTPAQATPSLPAPAALSLLSSPPSPCPQLLFHFTPVHSPLPQPSPTHSPGSPHAFVPPLISTSSAPPSNLPSRPLLTAPSPPGLPCAP